MEEVRLFNMSRGVCNALEPITHAGLAKASPLYQTLGRYGTTFLFIVNYVGCSRFYDVRIFCGFVFSACGVGNSLRTCVCCWYGWWGYFGRCFVTFICRRCCYFCFIISCDCLPFIACPWRPTRRQFALVAIYQA